MGSEGEFTLSLGGSFASISINVGNRDPEGEARAYREAEEKAELAIRGLALDLKKIYEHYADGHHSYQRHRSLLDRDRTEERPWDYRMSFDVPPTIGKGHRWLKMGIYVKEETPEALREKVLADLLFSQIGRPLFAGARDEHDVPLANRIVNREDSRALAPAIRAALARDRELRQMARKPPFFLRDHPDRKYQRFFALLFASAIDRAPVPAEAFDLLDELPPVAETWGPAGALLRFLPDPQWTEGIERIRRVVGPLVKSNEVSGSWWPPVRGT